ncbi:hypothetical protein [Paenibacillus senegalensis]|uniref:hypothetical protein n=1 Tax=Paenibacillus senegalensis TaxID=1465766 RepID=UPI00028A3AB8|nr:hypothetical protein [Paenibacillus senegalensis]
MLQSKLCKQEDFATDWLQNACRQLKEPFQYHRKLWEFCFITQALQERGLLAPGSTGLGFGVGKEPLVSYFASKGCYITATDLDASTAAQQGWTQTNQYAVHLQQLNERQLCDPAQFLERVGFCHVNMNHIPPTLFNAYNFTWSSCSFEHCGSIELGKQFILNQMNCLKPGGVAVHTTEFNLSSNDKTMDEGITVLFRLQDIEWMVQELRKQGHHIEVDYSVGTQPFDSYVDVPPYKSNVHLRLQLAQYISTSIGLIIQKKN